MKYDIVVCGGGISGAVAAISAARAGQKVLVAEQFGYLGGMLTAGGVGPMMTFHAGNKQVVQGITGELIARLAARGKSPGHIFDTTGYTYTVTPFDAEAMKHELETMLLEAGGQVLYHAMLQEAKQQGGLLRQLTFTTKNGMVTAEADVFIDATGDAELAVMVGVGYTKGADDNGICQPLTMNLKMGNVNIARVREYIKGHVEEFPRIAQDLHIVDRAGRLSIGGFVKTLEAAIQTGEIDFDKDDVLFFETNNPGEVIVNTSRMKEFDPTDPWQLSMAEVAGRKQALMLERFLIRRVPGFEQAYLIHSAPGQVGVRSSRQIKGVYTLTHFDLMRGQRFDDAIAYGGYPIDVHEPKGGFSEEYLALSHEEKHMGWGHVYQIPYRCLINETVPNLITVGRCISAEFLAQGAIRVSPIAGAVGHGGGAAAAIAAKEQILPTQVEAKAVRQLLRDQGAYLED